MTIKANTTAVKRKTKGSAIKKDWTIMVYMAGDNNLNDDMFAGILGLRDRLNLSPQSKVSFLIFFDGATLGAKTLQIDFSDAQAGYVTRNGETTPASISSFVTWCVGDRKNDRGHRAHNYALIFSGHGDGFLGGKFLPDDHPGSYLTGYALRKELTKVRGILKGKLKIIGFDSCVMNSAETAYEMEPFAEILIGSQGYFPNTGWDYGRIATSMSKKYKRAKARIEPGEMADIVAGSLIESNYRYALYAGRSMDVSWSALSKINSVAKSVYKLAKELTVALDNESTKGKCEIAILNAHWKCQTYYFDQCIDLADFCSILSKYCDNDLREIAGSCNKVIAAVEACVRRTLYLGPEFQYARGLSLFFPWSYDTYRMFFRTLYTNRDFGADQKHIGDKDASHTSSWTAFLDKYLSSTKRPLNADATDRPPQDVTGLAVISKVRKPRRDPDTPFFTNREFQNRDFLFNATEGGPLHRIGGEDRPRIGGEDRPRIGGEDRPRIGGEDRPRGGSVPQETKITKNLPWIWNEWGLSPEVRNVLLKARIIDETGETSGFIPAED